MLATTEFITAEQHIELVKEIIDLVDSLNKDNEEFHDILRSLPKQYFKDYVAGTSYLQGDVFVYSSVKYLMIADMPKEHINTDPALAIMRSYCLAYQGMYPHLWGFKEPVRKDMQRYPYGKENKIYKATKDATSNENTMPPNEDTTGLWELITSEII